MYVFLRYLSILVEVVPTRIYSYWHVVSNQNIFESKLSLHIKDKFEFRFKLRVVYLEHCFHKLLLVYILVIVFIHNLKEPFAQNSGQIHILHNFFKNNFFEEGYC